MICNELKMIGKKEIGKISKVNLEKFANLIQDHIKNCKECQPERLNPKTPQGDAIV